MKIKVITLFIVFLLLFTCFNVLAFEQNKNSVSFQTLSCNDSFVFSQVSFEKTDDFIKPKLSEATTYTMDAGKPMLPVVIKTYVLPKATSIKKVECTFSGFSEQKISEKIIPASQSVPLNKIQMKTQQERTMVFNASVYESSQVYPSKNYDYSITCGINGLILTVIMYPVSYNPSEDIVQTYGFADINVVYEKPCFNTSYEEEYDMVIIAPKCFVEQLNPLVVHKNSVGVKTFIKTTEDIYNEYNGVDKPEQIKYFIKDAKEKYGIKYVLLVGGLKSYINANDKDDRNQGSKDWYVPVRYTNIRDSLDPDTVGCISDLYYADLYRYNESSNKIEFENWDYNGNGIFAEGDVAYSPGWYEKLDLQPDVYYGRLPCRNKFEVKIMVNKIIEYESSSHKNDPWFKKMIAIGGKTFEIYEGQPDGEYLCDYSLNLMQGIIDNPVRVYVSNNGTGGPVPTAKDIIREFSRGAGFVLFEGHGSPFVWDTYWADSDNWVGGFTTFNFWRLNNGNKLPIVVVGGCHNALFNVTLVKTLLDYKEPHYYWTYGIPTRECFSWRLCVKPSGGAIACTGCTGFGLGYPEDPVSLSGELESDFFYKIGKDNVTTLGEAHSGSIQKYLSENVLNKNSVDSVYCITIYQLFGDPSLKIGGYS